MPTKTCSTWQAWQDNAAREAGNLRRCWRHDLAARLAGSLARDLAGATEPDAGESCSGAMVAPAGSQDDEKQCAGLCNARRERTTPDRSRAGDSKRRGSDAPKKWPPQVGQVPVEALAGRRQASGRTLSSMFKWRLWQASAAEMRKTSNACFHAYRCCSTRRLHPPGRRASMQRPHLRQCWRLDRLSRRVARAIGQAGGRLLSVGGECCNRVIVSAGHLLEPPACLPYLQRIATVRSFCWPIVLFHCWWPWPPALRSAWRRRAAKGRADSDGHPKRRLQARLGDPAGSRGVNLPPRRR